jgi:hypothetical protein
MIDRPSAPATGPGDIPTSGGVGTSRRRLHECPECRPSAVASLCRRLAMSDTTPSTKHGYSCAASGSRPAPARPSPRHRRPSHGCRKG